MSAEFWAIVSVGFVLFLTLVSIGDKLRRIIHLLELSNTMQHETRQGEWFGKRGTGL